MLRLLQIENIAIIEKMTVDFSAGLNILTGETGAGKSILIDSINAVSGAKTSRELIRTGAEYAFVSAVFTDVDKETVLKRIVGRVSCPNCHRVFNDMIDEAMPKVSGKCDDCGSELIRRTDDNSETFGKRYDVYINNTAPLIDYYLE